MDLSSASLLSSLLVSTAGFGLFLYGKKQVRFPQLVVGLVLMIFPYFVAGPWLVGGIGLSLVVGLAVAVRFGL